MKKTKSLKGYTIIELMVTLVIASAFSIGMYSVFISSNKDISRQEVLFDIKNYSTNALEIISKKLRTSEEITINNILGSTVITLKNTVDGNQETFIYSVVNGMIYENSQPLKIPGYHWLEPNGQDLYDFNLIMTCTEGDVSVYETGDEDLTDNIYDISINIDIESNINENYTTNYKTSRRIFAINKFAQSTAESLVE